MVTEGQLVTTHTTQKPWAKRSSGNRNSSQIQVLYLPRKRWTYFSSERCPSRGHMHLVLNHIRKLYGLVKELHWEIQVNKSCIKKKQRRTAGISRFWQPNNFHNLQPLSLNNFWLGYVNNRLHFIVVLNTLKWTS